MIVRWGHIQEEARRFRFSKTTRPATKSWKTGDVSELEDLQARFREFSRERDWEQFHDPRSLILALVGEVGELAELFQWPGPTIGEATENSSELNRRASEEISDILLYLIRLADVLNIDPLRSAQEKLTAAEKRYPARDFKGLAPDKTH